MKIFLTVLFLFFSVASSVSASEKDMEILGTYGDWTAYMFQNEKGKICYMATEPIKSEGKYKKRDDVFLFVTHHPDENSYDVVNVMAGYTYKSTSKPIFQIDKNKSVNFKIYKDTSWATDEKMGKNLVSQMKKGSKAVLKGTSQRGTLTTDTFSLIGFSKAYRDIQKACGRE
jgi:invasion protein IalB